MDNKIVVKGEPQKPPQKLTLHDMSPGQIALTSSGYYLIRTTDGVTFLGDGSGSGNGDYPRDIQKIFPAGTELVITVNQ